MSKYAARKHRHSRRLDYLALEKASLLECQGTKPEAIYEPEEVKVVRFLTYLLSYLGSGVYGVALGMAHVYFHPESTMDAHDILVQGTSWFFIGAGLYGIRKLRVRQMGHFEIACMLPMIVMTPTLIHAPILEVQLVDGKGLGMYLDRNTLGWIRVAGALYLTFSSCLNLVLSVLHHWCSNKIDEQNRDKNDHKLE